VEGVNPRPDELDIEPPARTVVERHRVVPAASSLRKLVTKKSS
jgi:hypothetical protein